MGKKDFSYDCIAKWNNARMPEEIEEEVLNLYVKYSEEHEFKWDVIHRFYEELEIDKELVGLLESRDLCLEGLDVIDIDKLIDVTYKLLIYMDNQNTIDAQWSLLLRYTGRLESFPQVRLRKHVISVKDIQKAAVQVDMDQSLILPMVTWATSGLKVFVNYLDFAQLLGKMGILRY